MLHFEDFYTGFIAGILWAAGEDENGEPIDANYDSSDISDESEEYLKSLARVWWHNNSCYLEIIAEHNGKYAGNYGYSLDELAGHDFGMILIESGVGFQDRNFYGYGNIDYSERFHKQAERLPRLCVDIGDDNKIHLW